jgi:hypothetical protein
MNLLYFYFSLRNPRHSTWTSKYIFNCFLLIFMSGFYCEVYVDCTSSSISSDFLSCWLFHEAWHGIKAQGLEFESWFLQFIKTLLLLPSLSTYRPLYSSVCLFFFYSCLSITRERGCCEVYRGIALALSTSSDFWLRWLVHEAWQLLPFLWFHFFISNITNAFVLL